MLLDGATVALNSMEFIGNWVILSQCNVVLLRAVYCGRYGIIILIAIMIVLFYFVGG